MLENIFLIDLLIGGSGSAYGLIDKWRYYILIAIFFKFFLAGRLRLKSKTVLYFISAAFSASLFTLLFNPVYKTSVSALADYFLFPLLFSFLLLIICSISRRYIISAYIDIYPLIAQILSFTGLAAVVVSLLHPPSGSIIYNILDSTGEFNFRLSVFGLTQSTLFVGNLHAIYLISSPVLFFRLKNQSRLPFFVVVIGVLLTLSVGIFVSFVISTLAALLFGPGSRLGLSEYILCIKIFVLAFVFLSISIYYFDPVEQFIVNMLDIFLQAFNSVRVFSVASRLNDIDFFKSQLTIHGFSGFDVFFGSGFSFYLQNPQISSQPFIVENSYLVLMTRHGLLGLLTVLIPFLLSRNPVVVLSMLGIYLYSAFSPYLLSVFNISVLWVLFFAGYYTRFYRSGDGRIRISE